MSLSEVPLLSIKEVAKFLNLSKRSVQRLISSGELRAYTIGGSKRISAFDVERLLYGDEMVNPQDKPTLYKDLF